jgi:hypothetical protein
MHLLACADNGVHGARRQAFRTADADFLIDERHQVGALYAVDRIQR